MALTLAQARTRVRSRVNESVAAFWSDDEIRDWLNEGQNDVARRTEALRTTVDIVVSAGTQDYSAPADIVRAHALEWLPDSNNQIHPLVYRDYHNADNIWGSSQANSDGTPGIWTTTGFPGELTIRLFPTPHEAGNIRLHYYKLPAALVADVDNIGVPTGWEDLVVEYATMIAFRKDGNPQWQEAFQSYENKIDDLLGVAVRYTDQAGSFDHGPLAPNWLYEGSGW